MMDWLLKILFMKDLTGAGGSIQWPPHFPRIETPLEKLLFLALAALAIVAIRFVYQREPDYVTKKRKRTLVVLRSCGALLLLFVASGAFLEVLRREDTKRTVIMLFDASASMSIADRRTSEPDLAAVAKILGKNDKLSPQEVEAVNKTARADLVKQAFAARADLIKQMQEQFKIEAYTFGQHAQLSAIDLADAHANDGALSTLPAPTELATQVGGALRDAARRLKGRKADGVVIVTDGGSNRGEDPMACAQELGSPIFPIGVGVTSSKDYAIPFIFAEDVVFKGDSFPLSIRIKQRGYDNQTVTVTVRRDDEIVKEENVEIGAESEVMHVIDITPDKEGVFTYSAEIEPRPEEASVDNNKKAKAGIRVIDKKIRVLLVDESPRWETRYLKSVLDADPRRIEPTYIIHQADERLPGSDPRFRKSFPTTAAELRNYDVIMLGNIASNFIPEQKLLQDFVQKDGGGLLIMAGRNNMPDSYRGMPLENLLPVEIDPQSPVTKLDEATRSIKNAFRPVLTDDGKRSPALTFDPDLSENQALWGRVEPMFWHYPAKHLKPGARALLAHPNAQVDDLGAPIIAQQHFGKGQVLYFGTDETWRWRFHPGAQYHRRMWGQVISSLSMAHLMGKTNRIQLDTDKKEYAVGEKVQIYARVLDKDYNPIVAETVTAIAERGELNKEPVTLTAKGGVFQGEFNPSAEGGYRLVIQGDEDETEALITVASPKIEFEDTGMRQDLLEQIAAVSGGAFLPLQAIDDLPKKLLEQKQTIAPKREERTLWNAPGVMVLFALLLGCEWFLRKRSDLL